MTVLGAGISTGSRKWVKRKKKAENERKMRASGRRPRMMDISQTEDNSYSITIPYRCMS
jgi:hypothetical protein